VFSLRSQFFQSLRHLSSQPKLLSATRRFDNTAKVCNSFLFAISTVTPGMIFTLPANFLPVQPRRTKRLPPNKDFPYSDQTFGPRRSGP
jgi:hypothetical protein